MQKIKKLKKRIADLEEENGMLRFVLERHRAEQGSILQNVKEKLEEVTDSLAPLVVGYED